MQRPDWIGLRERDNFFYTKGAIPIYDPESNNSIIISNSKKGFLQTTSNNALIKDKDKSYLIPITEIDEILNISSKILKGKRIFYKKPYSIKERENLERLSQEEIIQGCRENYDLKIKNISQITNGKGKNRIYKIISKENEEFILKYRGKNPDLFEAQSILLKDNIYFPKIINTKNSEQYMRFNQNVYAIEEFVKGQENPLDKEKYFEFLGETLALMHNEISSKVSKNKNLEEALAKEGNSVSESNLISIQIDLMNTYDNQFLLNEMKSFYKNLSERLKPLPNQIIHGDINRSNLIWTKNNAKIIDSETMGFSKRIREFIPALLLKGNFQYPAFVQNSARELSKYYNFSSNNQLTEAEHLILPDLLKFSLLKLYTVYNIRRNKESSKFKKQVIDSLDILGGEFYVY